MCFIKVTWSKPAQNGLREPLTLGLELVNVCEQPRCVFSASGSNIRCWSGTVPVSECVRNPSCVERAQAVFTVNTVAPGWSAILPSSVSTACSAWSTGVRMAHRYSCRPERTSCFSSVKTQNASKLTNERKDRAGGSRVKEKENGMILENNWE